MTETARTSGGAPVRLRPPAGSPTAGRPPGAAGAWPRLLTAVACAALGFLLIAQLEATEDVGERLDIEREEDLAQILSDLTTQSDRLQEEITELRLTLLGFSNSVQSDELAVQSLQRRLDELRVLAGTVEVEGEGVRLTIEDPDGQVVQELLVDTVQELRDAGAEAIAVNDVRLVASSSFTTRNNRLVVDGQPLRAPYRIAAIGSADTIAEALAIPGGAVDALQARPGVTARVSPLEQLTLPARPEPAPFLFGEPVRAEDP